MASFSIPTVMNAILNFCCVLSVVCLLSLVAGNVSDRQNPPAEVKLPSASSQMSSKATTVFTSHARTKAVQYFDTYRSEPFGLPPGCVSIMNPSENSQAPLQISVGQVIREDDRVRLLDAPAELVRVFPAQPRDVRYCMAGNQLVAVDANCRVLDSIRIPTIRSTMVENVTSSIKLASHQF